MTRDSAAPQRRSLLTALSGAAQALSAHELYQCMIEQCHPVGLATVHRALDALVQDHHATRLPAAARGQRYLACSPRHHHHVVRTGYGHIEEIQVCPDARAFHDVEQSSGFLLKGHVLDGYGLCPSCRSS